MKICPTYRVKIAAGALVCTELTTLSGDIKIGRKTIIHPTAKIIAEKGPIIIGECNLIEDRVEIINTRSEPMIIGSFNVFEVDSHCSAVSVGSHNVLEYKSFVGPEVTITDGCVIGAACKVYHKEVLPHRTVIYGSTCKRRIECERPATQTYQLDFLIKILPNYQKLEPANCDPFEITSSMPVTSASSTVLTPISPSTSTLPLPTEESNQR